MPSKWTRAASGISHRIPQEYQVTIPVSVTTSVDSFVYIATHPVEVTSIKAVWVTATTSGTAVLRKCTSTTVSGGTAMHATAIDLTSTAGTVNTVTLTTSTATLQLAAGNTIGLDITGSLATLAGAVVQITLKKID